jgi:hypothetical protein
MEVIVKKDEHDGFNVGLDHKTLVMLVGFSAGRLTTPEKLLQLIIEQGLVSHGVSPPPPKGL